MTDAWLVVGDVLALGGTAAMALGVLGVVRFPDASTRLHAASLVLVAGVGTVLLAAVGATLEVLIRAALVAVFLAVTTPVGAHALAHLDWRLRSAERRSQDP